MLIIGIILSLFSFIGLFLYLLKTYKSSIEKHKSFFLYFIGEFFLGSSVIFVILFLLGCFLIYQGVK